MSLLRKSEFDCLRVAINKLKQPPLKFSKLQPNEVKRKLGPATNALESLLEKTVGLKKIDQAGLLLHHLKRIYPKGGHLNFVVQDFPKLRDFSTISKIERRNYRHLGGPYKTFDLMLSKIAGSAEPEAQRFFLDTRFKAVHEKKKVKPLTVKPSWIVVKKMVENLVTNIAPVAFSTLSKRQKFRENRKVKEKCWIRRLL